MRMNLSLVSNAIFEFDDKKLRVERGLVCG